MKPLDILDALSDLPEEYTAFAVQNDTSEISSETAQSAQEEIVMNTQTDMKKKQHTFRIGKAGIAAAVAVCIGLNAALIYGIRQMKTVEVTSPNPAFSAGPGGAEPDETVPHMELIDAMPTGAQIVLLNPTDEELSVSGRFAVYQGSERAAECEEGTPGAVRVRANDKQSYIVNFPQLPAGEYTLYNLSENGKEPGTFGCVDFEISAEYDSMVWIPEIHNMPYEEAKALLEEKGVQVSKAAFAFVPDMDISDFEAFFEVGDVVTMSVPPYKTEVQMLGTQPYWHRDGKGYWVQPGETVTLEVYNGADGDPSAVPAVAGMDYEEAQKSIWAEGFTIEKHLAYDPVVPAVQVIST